MTAAVYAYARISTGDQDTALQLDALKAHGVDHIFEEQISGVKKKRPKLEECLRALRGGDTLVVWRLDRLGRKLKELLEIVDELDRRGIEFVSLTENIDTTTATGRLVFQIFGAFAEFERNLIVERTRAGLAAARKRGYVGGREWKHPKEKIAKFKRLVDSGDMDVPEVCAVLKFGKSSWYRNLKRLEVNDNETNEAA